MSFLETTLKILKKIPGMKYNTSSRRKRDIIRMVDNCAKRRYLSGWEKKFIRSIKGNTYLSDKQFDKLLEIYQTADKPHKKERANSYSIYDGEEECCNSDPRFSEKHSVSWDDVHDFDKD